MSRLAPSLAILIAASAGFPAWAADYAEPAPVEFRSSYQSYEPKDWTDLGEEGDGIHIETGLRYWYSMGSQSFETSGSSAVSTDTTHSGEAHLRIEDDATATYAKAWVGYSAAINGDYADDNGHEDIVDGTMGYAGGDFGWNMFNDGHGNGVGGFLGYNYWNNSPRTARVNYTTATSASDISYDADTGIWSLPGESMDDRIEYHMLRVGLSGKAEFNNFIDISGELAAVPYAAVNGVLGGDVGGYDGVGTYTGCGVGGCLPMFFKGSETSVSGWGYGGMGELMVGIKPTENLTLRLGGRAWYLQGTYDANWRQVQVTPPARQPQIDDPNSDDPADLIDPDPLYSAPQVTQQQVITTENPFSAFRYGLLAEITYSF